MIISERIFQVLKEKRISQKYFSEQTGIAQSTISDWKRKKRILPRIRLWRSVMFWS